MRMGTILKRILSARPEVQGAMIATFNVLNLFDLWQVTEEQASGVNLALVAWFGLAAKVGFQQSLEQLEA